jgi:hypothetical protein
VEHPEVVFVDTIKVRLTGTLTVVPIATVFQEICVLDSLLATAITLDRPAIPACRIINGRLEIETIGIATEAVVTIQGTRLGFRGVRFPQATRAQMERNNEFWSTPELAHDPHR